jgi:hypothetical protein
MSLIKKLFSKLSTSPKNTPSDREFEAGFSSAELGRRKFPRILFPKGTGSSELPEIILDHGQFDIVNLSLGGAALSPIVGSKISVPNEGQMIEMTFIWKQPASEIRQKAAFRGIRHQIWAFEFENPSAELTTRLTQLLEPGVEGTKMVSVSPTFFKDGESLLEWYRSPMSTEIIIRGENVDGIQQVDIYLRNEGIFWTPLKKIQTARMESQRGFNPRSDMRNMSDSPYFIYIDEKPNTELVKRFFLMAQNIPQSGPALKVFLREMGHFLRARD